MKKYYPVYFALVLVAGILMGNHLNTPFFQQPFMVSASKNQFDKLSDVINYIQQEYVDTVRQNFLVDVSIEEMLKHLDPHSAYIKAEELDATNEPLEGNFDGIGIEFHIQQDTIMVVTPIAGGPSEMVGVRPGDRIVSVNGKNVAGIGITNSQVMEKLRGESKTKVKVGIYRRGTPKPLDFIITRGKIPIYSLDVAFMADNTTGYIKISRFGSNTYDEYLGAFEKLKLKGMKQMILDLRGNPGGYLDAASKLADEFLPEGKMIVYTQGKAKPKTNYKSTATGSFESGKVAVLLDEGSASASEILAGALQDWDRATIIGRRSFGKGLVQEQTVLPDGSAIRLTIARYYTPTGRCIQKPYKDGVEAYHNELGERVKHGELENADSISFSDTLKYKTPAGRTVYGGGGIMPDIFIPLDTTQVSAYFALASNYGLINQFAYDFVDKNRMVFKKYKTFDEFDTAFKIDKEVLDQFNAGALKQGIKQSDIDEGIKLSGSLIANQLKAFIARQLWGNEGFYPVLLQTDNTFKKALEHMRKNEQK